MTENDGITKKLKISQMVFLLLTISICGLTTIGYSWQGYATLTERPGYRGAVHNYYDLTIGQFATYNFIVAFLATGLILFQIRYLLDKNAKKLTQTFWTFGLLAGAIVLAEIYLQSRFVPKG